MPAKKRPRRGRSKTVTLNIPPVTLAWLSAQPGGMQAAFERVLTAMMSRKTSLGRLAHKGLFEPKEKPPRLRGAARAAALAALTDDDVGETATGLVVAAHFSELLSELVDMIGPERTKALMLKRLGGTKMRPRLQSVGLLTAKLAALVDDVRVKHRASH